MALKVHRSTNRIRRRHSRLQNLEERIRQQINDTDCLLETLEDYCRENPHEKPCVADNPGWREQIMRQREELQAMLAAVRDRLGRHPLSATERLGKECK
jgi:hypothetical protein